MASPFSASPTSAWAGRPACWLPGRLGFQRQHHRHGLQHGGNFAYVDNNSTGWHLDHEAVHNLNLAVFGSIFHFIGFIREMGTGAGAGAFSEVLADSNDGQPGMWDLA